jgi:predicted  nucleic acid-binding Zn-ribbon protein
VSLADELRDADIQCAELSEYVEPDRAFQMPWEVREAADAAVTALARLAIMYKEQRDSIPKDCTECAWSTAVREAREERDLAHDHILQLETERDTARSKLAADEEATMSYAVSAEQSILALREERDRARDLAVGLEQELARLRGMLGEADR